MCWFITIAVPATAQGLIAGGTAARGQLSLTPQTATPTTALFPSGARCALITHGGCACALFAVPRDDTSALDALRARGIRAGWSAAKLARAIDGRRAREPRLGEAAAAFRQFVADLAREAGTVWLFAHFHASSPHTDAVGATDSTVLDVAAFLRSGFPPDTLARVSPTRS